MPSDEPGFEGSKFLRTLSLFLPSSAVPLPGQSRATSSDTSEGSGPYPAPRFQYLQGRRFPRACPVPVLRARSDPLCAVASETGVVYLSHLQSALGDAGVPRSLNFSGGGHGLERIKCRKGSREAGFAEDSGKPKPRRAGLQENARERSGCPCARARHVLPCLTQARLPAGSETLCWAGWLELRRHRGCTRTPKMVL